MTRLMSGKQLRGPILAIASLFFMVSTASADLITDPAGDFLPSYTGPHNGDLDVVSAQVFLNGSNFVFTSTQNGLIGTTPTGLYVWGIDRGAGTVGFPDIAPGVTFDSVLVLTSTGTGAVHDFINGTNYSVGVTISGSTISAIVPVADLVSTGFAPADYLVNLWPRSGSGGEVVISDFAPDNSDAKVTVVTPEPGGVALAGGALLIGVSLLRRRKSYFR